MAYTDKDYFLTKIKESDLDGLLKDDDGEVQEDYLTDAIATADEMIDSYLKAVVTSGLPLDEPGRMIKQCSYNIAMFYLHDRIQYNDIPDKIKENYDSAVKWLKDIKNGNVDIGIKSGTDEAKTSGIFFSGEENIFSRNDW